MNFSRKLLALLIVAALLCAAFALAAGVQSAAILIPLLAFCVCLTTILVHRVFERCDLPSSPFFSRLAARAPPAW